jgi:transposase
MENKRSINKAAKIIGLNISTAKVLMRNYRKKQRLPKKATKIAKAS